MKGRAREIAREQRIFHPLVNTGRGYWLVTASSSFLTWVQGLKRSGHPLLLSLAHLRRAGSEMKHVGTHAHRGCHRHRQMIRVSRHCTSRRKCLVEAGTGSLLLLPIKETCSLWLSPCRTGLWQSVGSQHFQQSPLSSPCVNCLCFIVLTSAVQQVGAVSNEVLLENTPKCPSARGSRRMQRWPTLSTAPHLRLPQLTWENTEHSPGCSQDLSSKSERGILPNETFSCFWQQLRDTLA